MNSPHDDSEHGHGQHDSSHSVVYLTANDLYNINEEVTGRIPFVRDRHLLLSAERRPRIMIFGEEQFPTLYDKAAALLHSLAYHHLFVDGNKRTAIRAVEMFLEANDLHPIWHSREEYDFVLRVAQGQVDVEEISSWIEGHTQSK
jgi:death-on-curing protein